MPPPHKDVLECHEGCESCCSDPRLPPGRWETPKASCNASIYDSVCSHSDDGGRPARSLAHFTRSNRRQ